MEIKFVVFTTIKSSIEKTFNSIKSNSFLTQKAKTTISEKKINLEWNSNKGDYTLAIAINFEFIDSSSCLVKISETGWSAMTPESIEEMNIHSSEWMQKLCSIKKELEKLN